MKRVLIISRHDYAKLKELLDKNNFQIVKEDPDFIVCFGGDGTILFSERFFPGIPKLLVKNRNIGRKIDYTLDQLKDILSKISEGKYYVKKEMKLETKVKKRKLIGLNEIQIHNKLPIHALRFSLTVNGKNFDGLIGDGVIIATPFGSTGYYESTGGKEFKKGIGISFNNLHNKKIQSFVVSKKSIVTVEIHRGPALLFADNNEQYSELIENVAVSIRKSDSVASFIYV